MNMMFDPKAKPIKLAHIVLKTSPRRWEKMKEFYKLLLGAKLVMEAPIIAFLTYDDEHHRLAIAKFPFMLPKFSLFRGVDHVAFTFSSLNDLLATYERMKSGGVAPVWCVHHGGTVSIYYQDLDRNLVETQVDVFESIEATNEYIDSDDFQTNPIGVDFDPDEWIRRLKAGEPEEVVSRRVSSGPRHPSTIPRPIQGTLHWLLSKLAPPSRNPA
ncbi:MAG: VOC family protein [Pseudomonadota bacterium]